jgi:hypothetical protein
MRQPKRSDDKYWTGTRIFHEEQFISDLQDHIDLLNERIQALSIADVMAMVPPVTFLEKVNRVEVIDQKGRSYVNWKPTNKTELSLQDDGKTLKVFISN